jgi:hypothetical protein
VSARTARLTSSLALLTSVVVVSGLPASGPVAAVPAAAPSVTAASAGVSVDISAAKRIHTGRRLKFVVSGTTDARREIGVTYAPRSQRRHCASTYATDRADQWTYQTVEPGAFTVKDRILASAFGPGRLKLCAYLIAEDSAQPAVAVASTTVTVRRRR